MPGGSGVKGGGYTEGARVWHSTNQTIPDATLTIVPHNTEDYDTDNIHDPANPARLTCRTAGKYLIGATTSWLGNANGRRVLQILRNGTTYMIAALSLNSPGADGFGHCVVTVYNLAVNDYVQMRVYQTSGGDLTLVCNYAETHFWMHRIG